MSEATRQLTPGSVQVTSQGGARPLADVDMRDLAQELVERLRSGERADASTHQHAMLLGEIGLRARGGGQCACQSLLARSRRQPAAAGISSSDVAGPTTWPVRRFSMSGVVV